MNSVNIKNAVDSLSEAKLSQPFNVLGLAKTRQNADNQERSNRGYTVTVWLPDAFNVELIELGRNRKLADFRCVDKSGLFLCELPSRKNRFGYRLRVQTKNSTGRTITSIINDPYQYQDEAFYSVHHLSTKASNVYRQLGAQQIILNNGHQATRFAVYAPNASSCSVIGDFNNWDGRLLPMEKTQCGHFVLVVPDVKPGEKYKFELKDSTGKTLPHKSDPVGFHYEQYPSFASVVYDHSVYQWQDKSWLAKRVGVNHDKPVSIYEVHLGSWRKNRVSNNDNSGNNQPISHEHDLLDYDYAKLIEELIPYVKSLNFTHIEVLPISEHPFTGSWGYQPVGLFAPTSRFGNPDGFKAFVDACHQNNIGVIIDWVPAHFPEDSHGLAKFDGTSLYEYDDPKKGWHPDWNSYIYDYGKDSVRQFLVANALYWCEHFHVDGLRVDAVASMLYLDYSRNDGEWIPNVDGGNHNYEAISLLKWVNNEINHSFPSVMTIAEESTSFSGVSRSVEDGGLGFDYKWNMGWMHDTLVYINKDPMYRSYHHNDITFSMVYNYDEQFVLPISHDEVVHGKGSMIRKMPGDDWQKFANLRAFFGYMYAHPGKKLNFMGSEFAQDAEWNHDSNLSWPELDKTANSGVQALIKDINQLYVEESCLHELDYEKAGFEWLDHADAERSIIAFIRSNKKGDEVLVVCNFTPIPRNDYQLGVSKLGEYQVLLNTDSEFYGGSNYTVGLGFHAAEAPAQSQPYSLKVNLPPLSVLFIKIKE